MSPIRHDLLPMPPRLGCYWALNTRDCNCGNVEKRGARGGGGWRGGVELPQHAEVCPVMIRWRESAGLPLEAELDPPIPGIAHDEQLPA